LRNPASKGFSKKNRTLFFENFFSQKFLISVQAEEKENFFYKKNSIQIHFLPSFFVASHIFKIFSACLNPSLSAFQKFSSKKFVSEKWFGKTHFFS